MTTIPDLVREAYSHWDDPEVLARTGRELHDRNRLPISREILARAIELRPKDDLDSWAYLAFAHYRDLDTNGGNETFRRAIAATNHDEMRSALANFTNDEEERARLRKEFEDNHTPPIEADRIAHRFYGGEKEALDELKALHQQHPDVEDVRDSLLWTFMSGKWQGLLADTDLREVAIPLVNEKIAADPARISGWWMKLQMLVAEKDWDAVLDATAEALKRFPDEETVMQFRGRALKEKGDLDRAIVWLNRAIGAKPSFVGARIDLGKIYEEKDEIELAEEIFREIPIANPDYPAGPASLALFLARQERWDEAEKLIIEIWGNLPKWSQASLRNQPDAKPLLEREAVKAVVGSEDDK
jgi:tetratricopeptide (TPR) repeat protein